MDLSKGTLGAQDVAQATGTTSKQITDWCNQGHIIGQKGRLGKGHRRVFTFNAVMQIAVGVVLMQHGIRSPADAFQTAMYFSHFGSGHSGLVNDEGKMIEDPPLPKRDPGFPYHFRDGDTFLIVSGERSNEVLVEKGQLDLNSIFPQLTGTPAVFIAVNVTEVFKAVDNAMGKDWRVEQDQVYGRRSTQYVVRHWYVRHKRLTERPLARSWGQ